ncbi:unnamed protein product [Nezara viridula]|uniref:MGA conserved domain-containing protein n=1 Tax=Nezara viridula TaxID=85310 RepID=A0A9P0E6S5_NEZVI|nr:unnamed protein product [Nezara viridula]
MKTAVLQEPILLNVPTENTNLTERLNNKVFNYHVSEYSVRNISDFQRPIIYSDTGKAIKLLHLVSYLHSLRSYFKNKINIYFCDKCLIHFKNVILFEKYESCSCVNGTSSASLKIIDIINLLYSTVYPLEPKACIMGCLCKETVLKKKRYMLCGCIYSHNHLDHNNILKKIVKAEKKIWNKIFDVSSLKYSSGEKILDMLHRFKSHKNFEVTPRVNNVSYPELYYLQIEFYKLCDPLYEKCISVYCYFVDEVSVNHQKYFINACSFKKLTYPNLRYYFRCFLSLYIRALSTDLVDDCVNFKLLRQKSLFLCSNYSEFLLFFGFFFYCLKVLRFPKNKSLLVSKMMSRCVDKWKRRHLIKVLCQICNLYNSNFNCSKIISMVKCEIFGPVCIHEDYDQVIKYLLSNDDLLVINNIESLHILKKRGMEKISALPNLFDCKNIHYKNAVILNTSNCYKNVASSYKIAGSCSKNNLLALTTGKEEIDVIDGINIFSFESEPDMMEFTLFQNKKMGIEGGLISDSVNLSNSGRIVPTKTRDITKIKGWRNKIFCMNKTDRNHINTLKNVGTSPVKNNLSDEFKNTSPEIKEELLDDSFEIKKETEIDVSEEFKTGNIGNVSEKELDVSKCKAKNLNGIDYIVSSLKSMYLDVLSKDFDVQEILKKLETNKGIFESSVLDNYLNNRTELKINFDIPQPYYTRFSNDKRPIPQILPDIKMAPPKIKNEEMKEKIKQLSSVDFIKNMQGDLSKRKFIWVHGRPIMLDHETKKAPLNSSTKKRNASSDSLSEVDDVEKEDDVKRMKITKQLEFSDSLLSDSSESNQSDEVEPRKPYLSLLNKCQIDDVEEKCNASTNSLPRHKFPLVFPCTSVDDEHIDCAKFNQTQLVMVVNIGYNRPFLREVSNNLEKLKKDTVIIDDMWAHIAASAVCSNRSAKTVTRYLVPVVSEPLIEVVKFNIENVSTNIGNLNELNVCSVYRSICDSRALKEDKTDAVEVEIKDIVDDIVEYVVKRNEYELFNIPYDPDVPDPKLTKKLPVKKVKKTKVERELKRLINVTLVDNRHGNEGATGKSSCGNEHCLKGCICNSLNGKLTSFHCGKLGCMFECSCDSKSNYTFKNFMQHGRNGTLAKDESSWHQTVICQNNEVVEVKAGAGKSKREKKLPTRFRNNVLLGKEMSCLDIFPSSPENKKSPSPNKDKEIKSKESKIKEKDFKIKEKDKDTKFKEKSAKMADRDKEIKTKEDKIRGKHIELKSNEICDSKIGKISGNKITLPLKTSGKKADNKNKALISANLNQILNQSELKKMAKMCDDERNQILTLADVFVWCSIHFRYSCSCSAQVFILKSNRLVWKPTASRTHLTSKHMSEIVINKSMPKYHIYDRNAYCARTYGSVFNYKLRNSNPVFKSKRSNEIVNDVLSNTNSFLKIDYASINTQPRKIEPKTAKESDTIIPPIKMTSNWTKQLINKPLLPPNIIHNVTTEVKNRKRKEPDDERVIDATKPGSVVITNIKDEILLQNAKKRYRIGPAHFDGKGNYRSITCGIPAKTIIKQASSDSAPNLLDQEIISSLNVKEAKDVDNNKPLPKYGLLCLTQGFGYLPVKEFTQKKLQVQDPLSEHVFHCFKDIESANKWLNRFFKNRIVFESLAVNLKWVIVKPGILKHSQLFDKSLLENPSKIINKDGFLVDITNLNQNVSKQYVINSSLEIKQPDDPSKTRIIVDATELKHNGDEIPFKKTKISSVSLLEKNVTSTNQGIVINSNLIKKPNAFLQRTNIQEDHFGKINKTPSPNGSSHKAFFRLSSGSNSSNEGCFIPLVPTNISKESSFQIKNINENNCKETEPADLFVNRSNNSKSSNAISITEFLKQSQQQNLIIKRIPKTVPFNSKALAGKSILKTKFK